MFLGILSNGSKDLLKVQLMVFSKTHTQETLLKKQQEKKIPLYFKIINKRNRITIKLQKLTANRMLNYTHRIY